MKRMVSLALCAIVLAFVPLTSAWAIWEGNAGIAASSEFPGSGLYARSDMFPKNTVVEITNLETDKTVRAVITGNSGVPGLVAVLSPDTASSLGIKTGSVCRVRISIPSVAERPASGTIVESTKTENEDPDVNPAVAAASAVTAVPAVSGAVAAAAAVPVAPVPPALPSEISEPEAVVAEAEPVAEPVAEPALDESELVAEAEPVAAESEIIAEAEPVAEPALAETEPVAAETELVAESEPVAEPALAETEPIPETMPEAVSGSEGIVAPVPVLPPETLAEAPYEPVAEPMNEPEVSLVPAEPLPPEAPPAVTATVPLVDAIAPVAPVAPTAPIAPAPVESVPEVAVEPVPEAAPSAAAISRNLPFVETLAKGGYYIQIGSYNDAENVGKILDKYGMKYPLAVEKASVRDREILKVYIGPVQKDEYGAVLERFRQYGFKDAFVKKGK